MQKLSLQTAAASSGVEALEIMEYFQPDLLITDIKMPNMDGLMLIREARKRAPNSAIIILTAYEEFEYARQALEFRVLCYLVKPIDWDVLDQHVYALANVSESNMNLEKTLQDCAHVYTHIERTDTSHALSKITKYIRHHYTHNISLVQLSFYSGLSESYICTLFKKELEITFLEYVYELRLKHAIELLLSQQEMTVQDVAKMVGYQNDRQFFRLFKEHLGMSPQKFRDIHLQSTAEKY